jgi:hypothetical protein
MYKMKLHKPKIRLREYKLGESRNIYLYLYTDECSCKYYVTNGLRTCFYKFIFKIKSKLHVAFQNIFIFFWPNNAYFRFS